MLIICSHFSVSHLNYLYETHEKQNNKPDFFQIMAYITIKQAQQQNIWPIAVKTALSVV